MDIKIKKNYKKPVIIIKKFVINDIISSSGDIGNSLFIGGHEYRY